MIKADISIRNRKKSKKFVIRYFRWAIKTVFLLVFTLPIAYFIFAPPFPVYSILYGGLDQNPILSIPYGQSVCSFLLVDYNFAAPGSWLICPVGGVQTLLTGRVGAHILIPTLVALILFLIPIFVFGNIFCGWVCPLGSIIDGFDKFIERFLPKVNRNREKRLDRNRVKENKAEGFICKTCPFSKLLYKQSSHVANGVLVSALVGSAIFKFPIFCSICPIGIVAKGMFHLKAITTITGKMMPIIVELWPIPVIAILSSLREKRYWCRKICPVGASLNISGSFSPLLRPKVKTEKCVMKDCPKTCEDFHFDYCGACRLIDQKRCEKVCPQDIDLLNNGSLSSCTRCFECYIQCENNAIQIEMFSTPDAIQFLRRLKKNRKKKNTN
jgi:ferredoxin-type protein NapH